VWAELGVQPSGVRDTHPGPPLACVEYEDGCLLVQDSAADPVEETFDLAKLSAGCTVVGVGEVDGAGGAEVVVWQDGRKLWGIETPMDEGGPELSGDVPESVLEAVERDVRSGQEDEDLPDYFNAILRLGTEMTGYECGYPIDHPDEEPFEMLEPPGEAAVLEGFPIALADEMAERGLRPIPSRYEGVYTFAADTDVPGLSAAVQIGIERGRYGGIVVRGGVSLWSAAVAELLPALEGAERADPGFPQDAGELAGSAFYSSEQPDRADWHVMWAPDGIAGGVQWVRGYLDGPMATWFGERSSIDGLLTAVRSANSDTGWRHTGPRVRMGPMIVFYVLEDRYTEAADLMGGFLERLPDPSMGRDLAVALDSALKERFPGYAAVRSL